MLLLTPHNAPKRSQNYLRILGPKNVNIMSSLFDRKRLANLKVTDYFDSVKHSEHPNALEVNLDRSFISHLKTIR